MVGSLTESWPNHFPVIIMSRRANKLKLNISFINLGYLEDIWLGLLHRKEERRVCLYHRMSVTDIFRLIELRWGKEADSFPHEAI